MHNRFVSLLIAALLPLLLFGWFAPEPTGQIDFWLMWFIAMIFVGLPLLYAEVGLAQRSKQTPALGIQDLTRQADSSTAWRVVIWLTVFMALIIAALSIDAVSAKLLTTLDGMGIGLNIPVFALALAMVVLAGILSLLGITSLIAGVVFIGISYVIAILANIPYITFAMTDATLGEWSRAVILALVSVGSGTGLYWFNNSSVGELSDRDNALQSNRLQKVASKTVFPIWITQLVMGSITLLFTNVGLSEWPLLIYALGVLASSAFLMYYANTQLATRFGRFGIFIATVISIMITMLLVIIANPTALSITLIVISMLSAVILAIFTGWKMKISHMRKSLNFGSEGIYNLWRVTIRILVPLFITIAAVGWLIS